MPISDAVYELRYEEGYDIYDLAYIRWLKANHPEALPGTLTLQNASSQAQCSSQSTSSQSGSRVSKFLSPLPTVVREDGVIEERKPEHGC